MSLSQNYPELDFGEYSFPIAHCASNVSVKFTDLAFCFNFFTNSLTFDELLKLNLKKNQIVLVLTSNSFRANQFGTNYKIEAPTVLY